MIKNYLPIGTVVKIKNDDLFEYLIIGYFPINIDDNTQYDYSGVVYPQGVSYEENIILFNNDDIDEVVFEGYSDESTECLMNSIIEQLSEK